MKSIYYLPVIGNILLGYKVKKEGGAQTSTTLRSFTQKNNKVDIGLYSYGGCFSTKFNYSNGGTVKIGRYCSFATEIHYFAANHPMEKFSMSPYFFRKEWGFDVKDVERSTLNIGNDVWVGFGVLITSGCKKIGNGAVVAAGSVLVEDVPPYSVVGGVPGRVLKKRFDDETILLLEECKWWKLTPDELIEFHRQTDDPKKVAELVLKFQQHKNINYGIGEER